MNYVLSGKLLSEAKHATIFDEKKTASTPVCSSVDCNAKMLQAALFWFKYHFYM